MKSLNAIQQDLLQLVKGNYVTFNDKNARLLIAVLLEPHYLISRKLCMDMAFQCRMMFETMRHMYPEFWRTDYNMFKMIEAFSKSPEEGHRYLYGCLAMTVIQVPKVDRPSDIGLIQHLAMLKECGEEEEYVRLFDVGTINLEMRERLTAALAETATTD